MHISIGSCNNLGNVSIVVEVAKWAMGSLMEASGSKKYS
jgi:hypothetical protein